MNLDELFQYTDESHSLAVDQEVDTIAAAALGDASAYEALCLAYGPALRAAVSRYDNVADTDDVRQTALLALAEAIHTHDPERSPRLAGRLPSILREHFSALAASQLAMTVEVTAMKRFFRALRDAEGDLAKAEEIAVVRGMGRDTFESVRVAVRAVYTESDLGSPTGDDGEGDFMLAHPLVEDLYTPYDEAEDRILVDVAFLSVNDEEARIVEMSYGFTDYEPVADGEIAHRMGMTRPTVQRRRVSALGKMRKALHVTA